MRRRAGAPASLVAILAAATACAVAPRPGLALRDLREIQEASGDYAEIPLGQMKLLNNVWGKEASTSYRQRVFAARGPSGGRVFGWSWDWPDLRRVGGYPEVMFGPGPWHASRTDRLPRPVGAGSLPVRYDLRLESSGVHNVAFDLWITRGRPSTSTIAAEVMIWLANRGMRPLGQVRARPVVGGIRYALWVADGVSLGQPEGGRRYVAFVAEVERLSGNIDLGSFLDELLREGLLEPELSLASVELGTEVVSGSGSVVLEDYAVDGAAAE